MKTFKPVVVNPLRIAAATAIFFFANQTAVFAQGTDNAVDIFQWLMMLGGLGVVVYAVYQLYGFAKMIVGESNKKAALFIAIILTASVIGAAYFYLFY